MTTPIIPIWRHRSLERHHKKHCVEEPTCFQEVLGLTVQVSQQDYQIASEEAFEKAYIQYDAQEAKYALTINLDRSNEAAHKSKCAPRSEVYSYGLMLLMRSPIK